MPLVTKPIALDESFNTTGNNSENIADVVKMGLSEIASAITDLDASSIEYDNTTSGLTADNVQGAVDELASEKADKSALSDYQTVSISPVQIGGVNQSTVEGAVSALATQSNSNKSVADSLGDLAFINKDGVSSTKFLKGDGSWETVSGEQIQSDWEQSDDTKKDYIKNKPQDLVHTSDTAGLLKNDGTVDSTGYLPKSGGTMTGTITTPSDNTKGVLPKTTNTGTIGSSTLRYYSGYFNNLYLGVGNNTAITGIDSTPTSGNTQKLVTSDGIKSAIDAAVAAIYKPSGSKTCAQLVSSLLVETNQGNVYNMTDSGTTTSDFVEGQGKPIRAGDNVAIVKVDNSFKFDLLSGFVDLSGYIAKASTPTGLLKDDGSVDKTDYAPLNSLKDLAYISKPTGSDAGSKYLNGSGSWVKLTIPTVTDTYSGTSSDGMSGKAVKSAIDALDVSNISGFGAGKTLSALSETDGKISASFQDISITKSQVSDFPAIPARNTWYGTCATAAATAAKTVTTSSGDFVLATGNMVRVKFTNANTYNGTSTLSVDGKTATNIAIYGSTNTSRYYWNAGEVVDFVYDGTNFVMSDAGPATTEYFGITKLVTAGDSTSVNTSLTPSSLNQFAEKMITGYPVYSSASTYAVGACVRYGFNSYRCKVAITTAESFNTAHWDVIPDLQSQIAGKADDSAVVHLSGVEIMTSAKAVYGTDAAMTSGGQPNLFSVISNNLSTGTNSWVGRLTVGAKDRTFLLGTYKGMCGLGAHTWTDAQKGTGAAWEDVYINPDGKKTVYIGGSGWTSGQGYLKIQNSDGKVYYNKGTIASPAYYEIVTSNDIPDVSNFISKSSTVGFVKNDGSIDTNSYVNKAVDLPLSVANGGTGATSFTSGHALIGNGTGTLSTKAITDSTSASALSTNSYLVTERDVYYGTPKINNSKAYTSNTTIYAPTGGGTAGQYLKAAGSTSAPTWQTADTSPTSSSSNLITSGGVASALAGKQDALTLPLSIANGGTGNTSGQAAHVATTESVTDTLNPVGVTSADTNTLKRNTGIAFTGSNMRVGQGSATNGSFTLGYLDSGSLSAEASGVGSMAIGTGGITASGNASFASGLYNVASGNHSHATGSHTVASGKSSSAEGYETYAAAENSHVEGMNTYASPEAKNSHVEGLHTSVTRENSHVEGEFSIVHGAVSHAEGYRTYIDSGSYSAHVEGAHSSVSGSYAGHVEGCYTSVRESYAHAGGYKTLASGYGSFAHGYLFSDEGGSSTNNELYDRLRADSFGSFALGTHRKGYRFAATGAGSFAMGFLGPKSGAYDSTYKDQGIVASGAGSLAGGYAEIGSSGRLITATAKGSFTWGIGTQANADGQAVFGKYNATDSNAIFQVGRGTAGNATITALSVSTNGVLTVNTKDSSGGIWIQANSAAGGNYGRLTLSGGMPAGFAYNTSQRGTRIYTNGIAFADPYNGNSNNDSGWIRHIEETSNSGVLEIATGDDGNESIAVRQYNTSSTIAKELTLLDASGNTTITGSLILTKDTDAAATVNNYPALIIGGAPTAPHIEIDGNEIMAKGSGTTTAPLYLNNDGGTVYIGSGGLNVSGTITGTVSKTSAVDFPRAVVNYNTAMSGGPSQATRFDELGNTTGIPSYISGFTNPWFNLITMHSVDANYGSQLAIPMTGFTSPAWRYYAGGSFGSWYYIPSASSNSQGSTTTPVYISNGLFTNCSTYAGGTKVTLNGSNKGASTASFYAPTTAGTSGYYLKSNGSGAPTWAAAPSGGDYLPKSGGQMTGQIKTPGTDIAAIEPKKANYDMIGSSSYYFYKSYIATMHANYILGLPSTSCGSAYNEGALGNSSARWGHIYTKYSVDVSSDKRLKYDISYIGDSEGFDETLWSDKEVEDFVDSLKPCVYKLVYSDNDARPHHGFIAQDVGETLSLLNRDHSVYNKSPLTIPVPVERVDYETGETETIIEEMVPENPDYNYSLCYDEFIPDLVRYCQILKTKVITLEERLAKLEGSL